MRTVAIVGAGPGGLVAARYLKKERFEPVVFEQGGEIGGQWTGDALYSGIWPSMRTNTSRVLTAFSDLQHEPFTKCNGIGVSGIARTDRSLLPSA